MERVILFESTRFAIRAERLLKSAQIPIKVIPTPRKLSSNCGVSIAFSKEVENKVCQILKEAAVAYKGPYNLE